MRTLPTRRMLFPQWERWRPGPHLPHLVGDLCRHPVHPSLRCPSAWCRGRGARHVGAPVLSLTRAEQLVDTSEDKSGKSAFPEPGGVWIVAEFEAVRHDPGRPFTATPSC